MSMCDKVSEQSESEKMNEKKKVVYINNHWNNMAVSCCPSCNKHVDTYLYGRIVNFCPFCGQALDWCIKH